MKMQAVIDRFEGDLAVLEIDGSIKHVPRYEIPEAAREGDILILWRGVWTIDKGSTRNRKKEITALGEELWED